MVSDFNFGKLEFNQEHKKRLLNLNNFFLMALI